MSYQLPPDLAQLVQQHMAAGGYASEEDVLRDALHALGAFQYSPSEAEEEYRQAVEAIREGIADAQAGRLTPLRTLIGEAASDSDEKLS